MTSVRLLIIASSAALLLAAVLTGGCGQKGDLYLPDTPQRQGS